ncbi:MAG: J domain-containing protein [Acidobacteria bacterium]|nr:J domain-containing protein [Acidobacteriota bacterium]
MNFYEALNLAPSATTEEIEEAYRTLARKVHPDLNQHDKMPAEARMRLLNQIRDTLTDPDRRAAYDRELSRGSESAKVESAIDETLRESRHDILFGKRLKLTALAGLFLGAVLGLATWLLNRWQPVQPEPSAMPAETQVETPVIPPAKPTVPKSVSTPTTSKKKKGPEVVQFGSSTEEVLRLMGRPDHTEELPAQGIRILHYGKLRLVFKHGKLVPGSGIQKDR